MKAISSGDLTMRSSASRSEASRLSAIAAASGSYTAGNNPVLRISTPIRRRRQPRSSTTPSAASAGISSSP